MYKEKMYSDSHTYAESVFMPEKKLGARVPSRFPCPSAVTQLEISFAAKTNNLG